MYDRILLSIDLYDKHTWEKALPTALRLRETFDSELHLITVVTELPVEATQLYLSSDTNEKLARAAMEGMTQFIENNIPETVEVHPHAKRGTVYKAIIETAERLDIDLVVMAAHSPKMSDYLLGPNAARVVRHYGRSVLVVRD